MIVDDGSLLGGQTRRALLVRVDSVDALLHRLGRPVGVSRLFLRLRGEGMALAGRVRTDIGVVDGRVIGGAVLADETESSHAGGLAERRGTVGVEVDPINSLLQRHLEVGTTSSAGRGSGTRVVTVAAVGSLIGEELEGREVDVGRIADVLSVDAVGSVEGCTRGGIGLTLFNCSGCCPSSSDHLLGTAGILGGTLGIGPAAIVDVLLGQVETTTATDTTVFGNSGDRCGCWLGLVDLGARVRDGTEEAVVARGDEVVGVETLDDG